MLSASYVGAFTANTGVWGIVGWNAAGGATSSYLKGDDPLTGSAISGFGAWFGYGVGTYVVKPVVNTTGKWITGGWNPKFDSNWLNYNEVKGQFGISKEMLPSKIPDTAGNTGSAITTEMTGTGIQKILNDKFKDGNK